MWTSLALLSALTWTPAQAGKLELKNPRFTYGILGQERKDTAFLPGDLVFLAFDIDGLKVADDGQVLYSTGLELLDSKGKQVFGKAPQAMNVVNTLGGPRLPAIAMANIGSATQPGTYTMKVKVTDDTDKSGKTVATLERKFEVKKPEFGIVRIGFVYTNLNEEEAGSRTTMAPPLAVPGQNLVLHFSLVGYQLKGAKELPDIKVEMVIKGEDGQPVVKTPFSAKIKDLDQQARDQHFIPLIMPIQANRSGKFKIVVTATDVNANKTDSVTLDLRVIE